MLPSTKNTSTPGGTTTVSTSRVNSARLMLRTSGGKSGASEGFSRVMMNTYRKYNPASSSPGMTDPMNKSPTETPIWSLNTTSTRLGGIICASVPEETITPVARRLS